ncbi:MAG: nucleotide exchange factor GrpE [Candidatus Marinimicrobia bacterium]|jgi:molecular chaperone GrpE|nr:nucleotide exchange factor GrpE [Candidatus Neomarinimicrobiota bacterium]MDP6594158.1 nucleotide exchange factor GrpE [Candidatus Neomarinimicrobiota bacterium]|tara:strand:+ start:6152 stop:6772 length:621 start_codon:yes stop_codon:yes gene_type:complete
MMAKKGKTKKEVKEEKDRSAEPNGEAKTTKSVEDGVTELEDQIKELALASAELEDRHLRLRAEFDNYRKRKEREFSRLLQYQGEEVIKSLLPVIDDIERVVNSGNGGEEQNLDSVLEGINLILAKFRRRLSRNGVEPFESVGEEFDPELHEAMMTENSDEHDENIILQEFEKGYRYKDRVIRHAKVIVNATSVAEEEKEDKTKEAK